MAQPAVLRAEQTDQVLAAVAEQGYVVLEAGSGLSAAEIDEINAFCDETQRKQREDWVDSDDTGGLSDLTWYNPLLDPRGLAVLEKYVRHQRVFPLVDALLGGEARFSELDFRETVASGSSAVAADMPFHHDMGFHRASSAEKIARRVQLSGEGTFRHEHVCAITYLTDVGPLDPAFAVVPFTHRMPADDPPERGVPAEVRRQLGDDFHEVLLLGAAGTTIICAHLPPALLALAPPPDYRDHGAQTTLACTTGGSTCERAAKVVEHCISTLDAPVPST